MADVLNDELTAPSHGRWTVLTPARMTSAGGASLTRLPDGSILASGNNPIEDCVTLVARTELAGITGLRLELLPDPRLPGGGPGRQSEYGCVRVSELSAAVMIGNDSSITKPVVFAEAVATNVHPRERRFTLRSAIDGSTVTNWDLRHYLCSFNAIALATAAPLDAPADSTLTIRITCRDAQLPECTLGRFRLSVTNAPVTLFETSLRKALGEPEWNGRTRLGMVYYLREDWQAAAAVLRIAADAPEGTGTDRFLLALALHHLDRCAEARSYLERAIDWLRQNENSDTPPFLVTEAIAEIEGISRVQAEARMYLDPIFPNDPFAR
jgi:hypothetical protein